MPADRREDRRRLGAPLRLGQRLVAGHDRRRTARRCRARSRNASAVRMISSEFASACSLVSPHAVMPCPPRMHADGLRVRRLDRRDVQAELEARAAATAPRPPGRRSTPRSASPRRRRWPARSRSPGAGGRRARRRPARASRCRSTAPRRPCRAGSSRTRRPSRPRGRRPGRRRPARAAGPAAARPGSSPVSVPRSPPDPLTHTSSTGCPVTGSVSVPLAEVFPPA